MFSVIRYSTSLVKTSFKFAVKTGYEIIENIVNIEIIICMKTEIFTSNEKHKPSGLGVKGKKRKKKEYCHRKLFLRIAYSNKKSQKFKIVI
jgi:hypothetical protein